jgi:hypothetical protein
MISTTAKLAALLATTSLLVSPAALAARSAPATLGKAGVWSFPSCDTVRAPEYEYVYSGDPCVKSPADLAPGANATSVPLVILSTPTQVGRWRFPGCAESVEYEYIFSGCQF